MIDLFFQSPYYIPLSLIVISFFAGIKINYFLKLSSGDYIDDRKGTIPFIVLVLIGIISGITLSIVLYYYNDSFYIPQYLLALILPSIFIIKLPYNPSPIISHELKKHHNEEYSISVSKRIESLFLKYFNFIYIVIYLFMGMLSISKFYGSSEYIKIFSLIIFLLSILTGFLLGMVSKRGFRYIYTEMIYPFVFLICLFFLYKYNNILPFYAGVSLFVPASLVFGFSIYHTIAHILSHYDHSTRFNIIDFSVLLLPVPIIIILNFITYTNQLYFILLYIIIFMNLIIPAIHFFQEKTRAYKKVLCAIYILLSIPLILYFHKSFNTSLNKNLYAPRSKGFENIIKDDFSSMFINDDVSVSINGDNIFKASNNFVKNIQRSLVTLSLYIQEHNRILFIDGMHRFYRNPVIDYYKNSVSLNYVPKRIIDFQSLPNSGNDSNISISSSILFYLRQSKHPFDCIVDIPNLFDLTMNPFRFSKEYYSFIQKNLSAHGIFVQIINVNEIRSEFFSSTLTNLNGLFKNRLCFLFTNYLVILTSDYNNAFAIKRENILRLKKFLWKNRDTLLQLFYNDLHLLSHIIYTDLEEKVFNIKKENPKKFYFLHAPVLYQLDQKLIENYISTNFEVLRLIERKRGNLLFRKDIVDRIRESRIHLSTLKKIEFFCYNREYEKEIGELIKLKERFEVKANLRYYIIRLLRRKEKQYYDAAVRYEKDKRWVDAKKLYKAILMINKNNFNANYRLGILSITIQELDESFVYLQHALKLRKNNPKVLYQMGVLLFSNDQPRQALEYLERALMMREKTSSIFLYLGLCNLELGDLDEAKNYLEKAAQLDSKDVRIISSLERVNKEIDAKKKRWKPRELSNQVEAEEGENIPLPISESAREIRIKD
ncbi:MAG: hypothetical protein SVR08_09610 [Spirochaetota bacterium]|nr:hypothetical protein [Spirochaetota bacterium]